ncbi:hypothetical protein COE51_01125 [Bacillus pseudomycoides]|nr:hypothetical protein COE51_01125 [Bacillus pseudomycoides]
MSEQIELKVKVDKRVYYNHESSFGVFGLKPLTNADKIETLNKIYNNFSVSGVVQELLEGNEYDIVIEPSAHPKYGKGYTFVIVKYKKANSIEEQQAYIRVMLKENQANAILTAYPNHRVLDMMKDGTFDYSKVIGIGSKNYEKIKNYLLTNINIQEALVELQELNITFAAMKKLVDHFGSPELVVKNVKQNIYSLCRVSSFGFLKVDAYAMNRGDDKTNKNRIRSAVEYILHQEEQSGHSWMSIKDLTNQASELLQIKKEYVNDFINELQNTKQTDIYINDNQIALYKNYYYENEIKRKLNRLQQSESPLKVSDIELKIKEIEDINGFTYTEEQRNAIRSVAENNVFILNGKAGTGKTTALKGILHALSQYTHACCALSGKASKIMSSHGLNAMTIHRMLGVDNEKAFAYNELNKLPYPIVVLDEASMCSNYMMHSVITAIKEGSKLIILGDSGQLAPIGCGAVFADVLKSKAFPMQELTIVQRQASKSGILSCANEIREGKQIVSKDMYNQHIFGELKDFVVFPMQNKENIKDLILSICERYKHKDINEFQVICGLKSKGELSVKNLNVELQKIFNDISTPFVKHGAYQYHVNDKIIHNGNNYEAGEDGEISIFNGTLGKIVDIHFAKDKNEQDKLFIQFEGIDEIIEYTNSQLGMIELAYAISCHRSQGSTIQHVIFAFDYGSYMLLSRQFVYTGITRASKGCVMICENKALRHAIKTDHSEIRRTFLYDLLSK